MGSRKTITQHLRDRLYNQAGLSRPESKNLPSYPELVLTEWIPEFEDGIREQQNVRPPDRDRAAQLDEFFQLMRNRLIFGAFRYGRMQDSSKGSFDCIGSILKRLALYREVGNDELLVDIANLALVEHRHSRHPGLHYGAKDRLPARGSRLDTIEACCAEFKKTGSKQLLIYIGDLAACEFMWGSHSKKHFHFCDDCQTVGHVEPLSETKGQLTQIRGEQQVVSRSVCIVVESHSLAIKLSRLVPNIDFVTYGQALAGGCWDEIVVAVEPVDGFDESWLEHLPTKLTPEGSTEIICAAKLYRGR